MKMLLISLMLLLSSCASAGSWKPVQVPFEDQGWRICKAEIDGEEFDLKGFCYWQKEFKKRTILRDLVRRVHKFCAFDDKPCVRKHRDAGKILR